MHQLSSVRLQYIYIFIPGTRYLVVFCLSLLFFFGSPPQLKFEVDENSGVSASSAEAPREKGGMSVPKGAVVPVGGEVGACENIPVVSAGL